MPYLFDYGCLAPERMKEFVGDAEIVGGAILQDHGLVFGGCSETYQGCAVASAVSHKGKDVLGLVYRLRSEQMELLDIVMECHSLLRRVPAQVVDARDRVLSVYMYKLRCEHLPEDDDLGLPSPMYAYLHRKLVMEAYERFHTKRYPPERDSSPSGHRHRRRHRRRHRHRHH